MVNFVMEVASGTDVARGTSKYNRSIFWATVRDWKDKIWHAGGLDHWKDNGQGGGEVPHVESGQGHVQVPQVPLLSQGKPKKAEIRGQIQIPFQPT